MRASFLKLEMEQLARGFALAAADRRRCRKRAQKSGVTVQEARHRSLGELGGASDLEARQSAAAQSQDAGDAQRAGGFGGTSGTRRTIRQPGCTLGAKAREPLAGATLREAEAPRHLRDRLAENHDAMDHLGSTQRRELGFTACVHAAADFGTVLISQPPPFQVLAA